MQWKKVQDIDNNLTSRHFPRKDFFMLETPVQSFWKSQNYATVKNFQIQKFQNATMTHC